MARASLTELAGRVGPVILAGQCTLPVLPALGDVLAGAGLRRGSTVTVAGPARRSWGATALALSLAGGPSQSGSWVAVVGRPGLHPGGAAVLGLQMDRLALVPEPGRHWATVVGALLDALDVVVAVPPPALRPPDARRLAGRARERGAVLIPLLVDGRSWVEGADVRLTVSGARWYGLERGHGLLASRVVEVAATGRGAAGRERRVGLWLPGPHGQVAVAPLQDLAPDHVVGGSVAEPEVVAQ